LSIQGRIPIPCLSRSGAAGSRHRHVLTHGIVDGIFDGIFSLLNSLFGWERRLCSRVNQLRSDEAMPAPVFVSVPVPIPARWTRHFSGLDLQGTQHLPNACCLCDSTARGNFLIPNLEVPSNGNHRFTEGDLLALGPCFSFSLVGPCICMRRGGRLSQIISDRAFPGRCVLSVGETLILQKQGVRSKAVYGSNAI